MTERKIRNALQRIDGCKKQNHYTEALIHTYHLNAQLLRFILSGCMPAVTAKDQKLKSLLNHLFEQADTNAVLRSIINKKSLKATRPWFLKMEAYFKQLKNKLPTGTRLLQQEGEKIAGLLSISALKLAARQPLEAA